MATPTAGGTGLFKVYNWPLSASGGLSTVYVKAILEGATAVAFFIRLILLLLH